MANAATDDESARPMPRSFKIGSFKGTEFFLHWSYFAVFAFNMVLALLSKYNLLQTLLYTFLFYGPMVLLSLLVVRYSFIFVSLFE